VFAELFDVFDSVADASDKSGKAVIVNFGESDIIKRQTIRQLIHDALWAILSAILAIIMLRLGTQSTFLTVCGIFQIVVRHFLLLSRKTFVA
jgi:hypothetical protein